MAQGIYDLLQETLRLTTKLNKQLCCEPEPPPPVGTRKFWLLDYLFVGRNMVIPNVTAFFTGNTVANITGSGNANLVFMGIRNASDTGSIALNDVRSIRPDSSSPFVTITPDYAFNDGNGLPILRSFKELYAYYNKIINNTFLATRNPQIVIKRVSTSVNVSIPLECDGFFMVGIDFDSTGLERESRSILGGYYDFTPIPGTVNIANFTYLSKFSNISGSNSDVLFNTTTPSTTWINNTTIVYGNTTIRENFPIPPGW